MENSIIFFYCCTFIGYLLSFSCLLIHIINTLLTQSSCYGSLYLNFFILHIIESDEEISDNSSIASLNKDTLLLEDLRNWVEKNKPSTSTVNNLLCVLQKYHTQFPRDYRTLKNTPQNLTFKTILPGKYFHFGVKNGLDFICSLVDLPETIKLQINIDGASLHKSTNCSIWQILGKIIGIENSSFIIVIYCGNAKPKSVDSLLSKLHPEP